MYYVFLNMKLKSIKKKNQINNKPLILRFIKNDSLKYNKMLF